MSQLEPVEVLAAIRNRIDGPVDEALNPYAVATKHAELQRGGYGACSMPEGSRSSETPMPVGQPVTERDNNGAPSKWGRISSSDATDRELKRRARQYSKCIFEAGRLLEQAYQQQLWFLKRPEPEDFKLDDPQYPCKNLDCGNMHPLEKAECGRCRTHKHRHGLPWPKLPADAA